MVAGTPDYYQTVRQTYGAAKSSLGVVVVTASADNELVSVDGKGVIYGGGIFLDYTSSQKYGKPRLNIDGANLSVMTFSSMWFDQLTERTSNALRLIQYDNVRFRYGVALDFGITFEQNVTLYYEETEAGTPTVVGRIIYALM